MERRHLRVAGSLLILGTLWTVVAIRTAEVLTPGYNIWGETISGLGSTFLADYPCFLAHCNSIVQPSSIILVSSLIFDGILLLLAAYYIFRSSERRPISRMIALLGLGTLVLGLSYVPLYMGNTTVDFNVALGLHLTSALFLVCVGALLAIRADAFILHPYLKYISRLMGVIVAIAVPVYAYMFTVSSLWGPGFGGVERIGFYLIFAWFLGYGVYLLTANDNS